MTLGYGVQGGLETTIGFVTALGYSAAPGAIHANQPFVVYDSAEFERVRREKAEIDALLRRDLETAIGPSKTEIANAWAEALFYLDQNPGETVFVTHDIKNADLAKLVTKVQRVGMLQKTEAVGTVETPESSVTFAKGEQGWMFFRSKGNAQPN